MHLYKYRKRKKNMQKNNFIRKLGDREIAYIKLARGFSLSLSISSKLDLYADLNSVKSAFRKWTNVYPLLNARVVKEIDETFSFISALFQDEARPLENVKFLRIDARNASDNSYNQLSDLILQKYLSEHINALNEDTDLWKMALLQVNSNQDSKEFNYEVVVYFHHCISDGASGFNSMLKLFQIIEATLTNTLHKVDLSQVDVLPSVESLFADQPREDPPFPRIYRAKFIDPSRAREKSTKSERYAQLGTELDQESVFDAETDQEYVKIGELINDSKSFFTNFRKFLIDKETCKKISEKCRQNGTKMSSFFHTLVCFALKELYQKRGETLVNLIYYMPINLRKFLGLGNEKFGYCVGEIKTLFTLEAGIGLSYFWSICRDENNKLKEKLEDKREKFYKSAPVNSNNGELMFTFIFSNIGRVDSSLNGCSAMIKVARNFIGGNLPNSLVHDKCFINYATTIDNQISWLVSFNSHFIDENIVEELIKIYFELLKIVL